MFDTFNISFYFVEKQNVYLKKFNYFFFKALVWFFAFMVVISPPSSLPHLNFVFALVYCVLNVCFGILLLILAILLVKRNSTSGRVTSSGKVKLVESGTTQALKVQSHGALRLSANKVTMTPVE